MGLSFNFDNHFRKGKVFFSFLNILLIYFTGFEHESIGRSWCSGTTCNGYSTIVSWGIKYKSYEVAVSFISFPSLFKNHVSFLLQEESSEGGRNQPAWEKWSNDGTERQVAKLMEENVGAAMQFLQSKALCIMPISLASAIYHSQPPDASSVKPETNPPS